MSADLGYSSLFSQAIRDAREAFRPPVEVPGAVFDLRSRLEIVKASRDLTETVAAFDADLDPFLERIRMIDAPFLLRETGVVIDWPLAKDALLAKTLGLRVIEGGRA